MTRFRGNLPLLLLIGFGTVLGLAGLEAVARFAAVQRERVEGRLSRDLASLSGPTPRSVVTLGQIIRRSENPRLVYELRPRLDVVFAGARLTTSDDGHRGAEIAKPKPPSTFRIVGIGDSYMFGQGVADGEPYLARPELSRVTGDGRKVEMVNLAVPGFNTVMEVERLRTRIAALKPDLVLIEIVGNDLDLPNFLWNEVDAWTPRRSFLLDFIRGRLNPPAAGAQATGLGQAPSGRSDATETFLRDADHVPAAYRDMVGLPAFEKAIDDLASLARSQNAPVLALTHGVWFESEMHAALERNRVPLLILRSALRTRARQIGAPDYARSPLALSPTDLHPSALGHEAIAEELRTWLEPLLQKTKPTDASQPFTVPR